MTSRFRSTPKALFLALFAGFLAVACSDDSLVSPDERPEPTLDLHDLAPDVQIQELQPASMVLRRNTARLINRADVVATGVGLTEQGRPAINMYVDGARVEDLPAEIDGIPVIVIETGPIVALQQAQERGEADPFKKCPSPPCNDGGGNGGGGSFDPTAKHRPAPNGVSLGHPSITAGTLGAIVVSGGNTYILSNNHVLANEGNTANNAPAYQPGPFDGGGAGDQIGTLADYVDIVFSTSAANIMDAAIASVNGADVTNEAPGYGPPKTTPVSASVGMRVMKQGRTTGFTKGRVQSINATVNVGYDTGVARFVNQIVIGGGGFSSGGDSGSLVVVQNGSDARSPVGLLFAGGGGSTIANPIGPVLDHFGVTIRNDN